MTKQHRRHFLRLLRAFENATREDDFKGTIPISESAAAADAYARIEHEYDRSRAALINFVERIAQ